MASTTFNFTEAKEQIVKSDVEAFGSESELEYSSDEENEELQEDWLITLWG